MPVDKIFTLIPQDFVFALQDAGVPAGLLTLDIDPGTSTISAVSATATTATVTTAAPHGFSKNMQVYISNCGLAALNGVQTVVTVADSTHFTVSGTYSAGSYSGGTVFGPGTAQPVDLELGVVMREWSMIAQTSGLVLPPDLTNVTPNHATVGDSDLTITLSGNGFTTAAVARFDATPLATSYISSTALTAVIPASMLTVAGAHAIDVSDETGISNALPFAVLSAGGGGAGYYAF